MGRCVAALILIPMLFSSPVHSGPCGECESRQTVLGTRMCSYDAEKCPPPERKTMLGRMFGNWRVAPPKIPTVRVATPKPAERYDFCVFDDVNDEGQRACSPCWSYLKGNAGMDECVLRAGGEFAKSGNCKPKCLDTNVLH